MTGFPGAIAERNRFAGAGVVAGRRTDAVHPVLDDDRVLDHHPVGDDDDGVYAAQGVVHRFHRHAD